MRANTMKVAQQKRCSRCRESFTCGAGTAAGDCWCTQLPRVSFVANEDQDCLCQKCLREAIQELTSSDRAIAGSTPAPSQTIMNPSPLVEGEDYYLEGGLFVFTERYHMRRGYCCQNGCRHCPYTSD